MSIANKLTSQVQLFWHGKTMSLGEPKTVIAAYATEEVAPALEAVASHVQAGMTAAGFLSYEAGLAFDKAFKFHPPAGEIPLAWFALYDTLPESSPVKDQVEEFTVGPWAALVSAEEYRRAVEQIRRHIAAGDVYQVNYTFPLEAAFQGDAATWFRQLCHAQQAPYCAYIDTGRHRILSASPELFFQLEGSHITVKPMKGTRRRGRFEEEDEVIRRDLIESEKDRAENVMIVDLERNDLGRIAEPGSVRVESLWQPERYPTVWQLTSTISASTSASVPEIFEALFPCGSVTGAPKVKMTEVGTALEPYPRGAYCGCIGLWGPGRSAEFNVAIRTAVIDTDTGKVRYSVGGGITWDSSAESEYEECIDKARVLTHVEPDFELLESLRFDGEFFLADEHVQRLLASARYFGIPIEQASVEEVLRDAAASLTGTKEPVKVRLLASKAGQLRWTSSAAQASKRVRVELAKDPVDPADVFLFHKTTHREIYEAALASRPDCDDVILWNTENRLTESCTANLVLQLDAKWVTPPRTDGLLAGCFRRHLLEEGKIEEAPLTKKDLRRADAIWLINSVRKWIEVEFVD